MVSPIATAVELFSGIGGFAVAARDSGIRVVAAFDQNGLANRVYMDNFGLEPRTRTLDTIDPGAIPDADLWWMSPPCTPYTRRGRQGDDTDPRAASFLHLIAIVERRRPRHLLVENVMGFATSRVRDRLLASLARSGYHVGEHDLCPTRFGVPMRRPRRFVAASLDPLPAAGILAPDPAEPRELASYLLEPDALHEVADGLNLDPGLMARYEGALDLVDPADRSARVSCITRGYAQSPVKSGSFLRTGGGARRLAPREILALLGFPAEFRLPPELSPRQGWRLAGNSLDVRAVRTLLGWLGNRSPD